MSGSRSFHTAKKAQVITSLLTGETVSSAAQNAGVSERQVYRWLETPEFINEIHSQEHLVLNACSWRLVSLTRKALDALEDVIDHPAQPGAANKRQSGVALLELTLKYMDVLTFEERLERLERLVLSETR